MFTRVVELTSKPRKSRELSSLINDTIVPILRKQAGSSRTLIAIGFWR